MLSIIIVNYNSLGLIMDCLDSLDHHDNLPGFDVIIVDNSEEDPSLLLERYPFVQWIPMGYNAGFARANNKGMEHAKGEAVLLLNPDILFESPSISACYKQFRDSSYVACGVQLQNPDHTAQVSGSYYMTGGINHFLPLPFVGNFFKWLGTQMKVKKTSIPNVSGTVEVDWVNGAFLMVKKSAIEKAGKLDEDFFLYSEEIEWCARLRKQGPICIYGDLHAIHLQGETANASFNSEGKGYYNLYDQKGRQLMLSSFVRIRKQFGPDRIFYS